MGGVLSYRLVYGFPPPDTNPQSLIEVEAVDERNLSARESVIIYR